MSTQPTITPHGAHLDPPEIDSGTANHNSVFRNTELPVAVSDALEQQDQQPSNTSNERIVLIGLKNDFQSSDVSSRNKSTNEYAQKPDASAHATPRTSRRRLAATESDSSEDPRGAHPVTQDRGHQVSTTSQKRLSARTTKRAQTRKDGQNNPRHESSKVKKRVPQNMQSQWRVGAAPSAALALSREEAQITKVISQAMAFHTSMFEVFWGPCVREHPFVYDLDNRVELFRDSSVTAASLVAAGKMTSAQEVLDRVLPSMDDLFRNPPPQLYLILAELALGLVKMPSDALRLQIVRYLSNRAMLTLGAEHPISTLLRLELSQSRKEMLGDRLWKKVLPILIQNFGPDHYQSSTQVFCQARNMAACGYPEDAVRSIENLIDRWGQVYSANSLIVCYTKIELANILVAQGSNMKAEFVVSDALRTSDIIQAAEFRNEDCPASERRHRQSSIAYPRVAGLRTLGRLHSLRGNLGAATHYYSQAVTVGNACLGRSSAAVELAQDELERSRELEIRRSLEQFSITDVANLTNIVASPTC